MAEGLNLPGELEVVQKPAFFEYSGTRHFRCRSVLVGDKQSGEYHFKPSKIHPSSLITVLRGIIESSDIGMVPEADFPVYMKVDSYLVNESMEDLLKDVDEFISKQGGVL